MKNVYRNVIDLEKKKQQEKAEKYFKSMQHEKEKSAVNTALIGAETVGFEPTCPGGQLDFESFFAYDF